MELKRNWKMIVSAGLLALGTIPPVHAAERGAIEHVSGGVGLGARDAMLAKAQGYNLHLEFAAAPEGEYLADVEVTLADARGNQVLTTRTEGPWLFVRLPSGSYTLTARHGATSRTQQVTVGEARRRVVVRFPALNERVARDASATPAR